MENSNILSSQVIENLPDYEHSFFPVETDGAQGEDEMYAYSDLVYSFGRENCGLEPYQYGSYEIYQANTRT